MTPTTDRLRIAILAAGKGTRLKSKLPKVLHQIAGRPLLEASYAAALIEQATETESPLPELYGRFAELLSAPHSVSIGRHELKGFGEPVELFASTILADRSCISACPSSV